MAFPINQNDGFIQVVAAGGETELDFDFPIFDEDHIEILETDLSGNITTLVIDTDYTVPVGSINVQAGGTVDISAVAYPSGLIEDYVYTLRLNVPEERTTDFNQAGDFFAATLNEELDLITQVTQQLRRDMDRAARLPDDSTLTGVTLQDAPQDGYALVWDGVDGDIRNTEASLATLEGNASIVAANISSVNTVATNISNVNSVAGNATNINTVATNIADVVTVAANIADVVQAAEAIDAAIAYTFSSTTSMADPGAGVLRLNNATAASVTAIAIDDLTAQTGNPDLSAFIITWDDSSSTVKGTLRITKGSDPTVFAIYSITSLTDNVGWTQLAVTYVTGNGSFTASDNLYLSFSRTGDVGAAGSVSDGDKGDIAVTSSGSVWTLDGSAVTGKTGATIEATDIIIFSDTSDSGNLKKDDIQGILDLIPASTSGWVPIKTVTANNDATISFVHGVSGVVLDSTYKNYAIIMSNIVPSTDNQDFHVRVTANAGSSWDSGASDYISSSGGTDTKGYVNETGSLGSATGENFSGTMMIYAPSTTTKYKILGVISNHYSATPASIAGENTVVRTAIAAINGVQVFMAAGNIASGEFTLVGIKGA